MGRASIHIGPDTDVNNHSALDPLELGDHCHVIKLSPHFNLLTWPGGALCARRKSSSCERNIFG